MWKVLPRVVLPEPLVLAVLASALCDHIVNQAGEVSAWRHVVKRSLLSSTKVSICSAPHIHTARALSNAGGAGQNYRSGWPFGQTSGSKQEEAVVKAIEQLREQLADNETRKKLLNLLPSLVEHLEIDSEKKRYRIANHAEEVSGWRQVAK